MKLAISSSIREETDRVTGTLKKSEWYAKNGYRIRLPAGLDPGRRYRKTDIERAVRKEFHKLERDAYAMRLRKRFAVVGKRFQAALDRHSIPHLKTYRVRLTGYGVGGSYHPPDRIVVNIARPVGRAAKTVCHEIIHLIIHRQIERHKIPHWDKERIVDLTMRKIFGRAYHVQDIRGYSKSIDPAFKKYFPDLKAVITSVTRMTDNRDVLLRDG